MLRLNIGDIALFYLIRYGWHEMRLHLRRSADEGNTWGDPVCCIPEELEESAIIDGASAC